jgi:hypothetical protein
MNYKLINIDDINIEDINIEELSIPDKIDELINKLYFHMEKSIKELKKENKMLKEELNDTKMKLEKQIMK